MRILFLCVALIMLFFSCKESSDIQKEVTEIINESSIKNQAKEKSAKSTMESNTLDSYFPDMPFDLYENCHDEKGASEDFFNGTKIPSEVASEFRLYKIASIPKMGMKRKVMSDDVEFRAVGKIKVKEALLLFYKIGINVRTDKDEELGYETRVAVFKDGKVESNYFVGGHKSSPSDGSMSVCRTSEIKDGKLVFTLNKNASMEVPSILRLDAVEEREI